MRMGYQHRIRQLLRDNPDGMTVREIQQYLPGVADETIRATLRRMPDVYIDRWVTSFRNVAPVWCAVTVPPHAPRPDRKYPSQAGRIYA